MKKLKKIFLRGAGLLCVMFFAVFFVCCGHWVDSAKVRNSQNGSSEVKFTEIMDFGNGVYYFPYIRENFGNSLSNFIGNHPELEYVNSTGDGTGGGGYENGRDMGYFVVFREKKP
jgi:hypothetical protein